MLKISKNSLRQATTIFPIAIICFTFGTVFGWVAPAIEYLSSPENVYFNATEDELSWIASGYFAGEIASSIITGSFSNKMGRQRVILFASFLLALSWFIQIFATSFFTIMLSRTIMGISAGVFDVTWTVYIGEVTTPIERGVFGSLVISVVIGGIMVEFLLSLFVSYVYLSVIPFIISIIAFVLTFFMVETPQYLLMRGKDAKAIENLAWLRGYDDTKNIQSEFNIIKQYVAEEMENKEGILRFVKSPAKNKVVFAGIFIFLLAQSSGNIIIVSYETLMLEIFDGIPDRKTLTLMFGVLQFVFVNFSPFLIENFGRKTLLFTGFTASAVIQTANAYLFYLAERMAETPSFIPKMILILFNVYGVVFIVCIMPTVWVLKSEIFPQKSKAFGNCSSTAVNALAEFLVVKLCMSIWNTYGLYVNFIICAIINVIGVIYVQVLIPETRGQTLVEIQYKVKNSKTNDTALMEK